MKTIAPLIAALLAGCATTQGVVPIGRDTYMLSRQGYGFAESVGNVKAKLFGEAGAFCMAQGKQLQPVNTREVPGAPGRFPEAELQFMCLAENDPQLQRPRLEKTPDTVIELRK